MKIYSRIALLIFLFVLSYFVYIGITTPASEGDSLAYHIPIATRILNASFTNPEKFASNLFFYPGSSEATLSLFMFFQIPLNLYNVLGWVLLFLLTRKLGRTFGLLGESATVYATAVCLLPSTIRLLPTQTVDIWLAVFFTSSLILLENPKSKSIYYLQLGFMMGMLIGTKYSGLLFALILMAFYFRNFIKNLNLKRFIIFSIPFFLFGLFWYVRNYIFTHNPFYPGSFLIFKGDPAFQLQDWQPWKTIFFAKNGPFLLIQALISEFIIWSFSLVLGLVIIAKSFLKKNFAGTPQKLVLLGISNFIIYLLLPSWPENLVSDLRYALGVFIPLILACFLLAKKYSQEEKIVFLALAGIVAVVPQLNYFPKLFVIFIFFLAFIVMFYNKIKEIYFS